MGKMKKHDGKMDETWDSCGLSMLKYCGWCLQICYFPLHQKLLQVPLCQRPATSHNRCALHHDSTRKSSARGNCNVLGCTRTHWGTAPGLFLVAGKLRESMGKLQSMYVTVHGSWDVLTLISTYERGWAFARCTCWHQTKSVTIWQYIGAPTFEAAGGVTKRSSSRVYMGVSFE